MAGFKDKSQTFETFFPCHRKSLIFKGFRFRFIPCTGFVPIQYASGIMEFYSGRAVFQIVEDPYSIMVAFERALC